MNNLPRREYQRMLKIDKEQLDRELAEQPTLYENVGELHAIALANRDSKKNALEIVLAETDRKIRKESKERITEAQVAKLIELDDDVQQARHELVEAKLEESKWAAVKDAYSQRAYILRDLAQLYMANYYAKQSVYGKVGDDVKEVKANQRTRRTKRVKPRS